MEPLKLDRIDQKILDILDRNSRLSFAAIGKEIRLGSDIVEYRIKKYIEIGLIKRFSAVLNVSLLGENVYKIYIKHRLSDKEKIKLVNYVDNHSHVYRLMEGGGCWDLQLSFLAKNPQEFSAASAEVLNQFSGKILEQSVSVTVRSYNFSKKYLSLGDLKKLPSKLSGSQGIKAKNSRHASSKKSHKINTNNFENRVLDLTEIDFKLIGAMMHNARAPLTKLVENIELTSAGIDYRLKRLESLKMILGYQTQIDVTVIGYMFAKIFIEAKYMGDEAFKRLYEFCSIDLNVIVLVESIGRFQYEIQVQVRDHRELQGIIDRLRDNFNDVIGRIESMIYSRDYYHRLPKKFYS